MRSLFSPQFSLKLVNEAIIYVCKRVRGGGQVSGVKVEREAGDRETRGRKQEAGVERGKAEGRKTSRA